MANPLYRPAGRALKLVQAALAEPLREFTSIEATEIMGCTRNAVAGMLEYSVRNGVLHTRKEGRLIRYRATPYQNQPAQQQAVPTQAVEIEKAAQAPVGRPHEGCTCSIHSPFRWRESTEPSIFAQDPAFRPRDAAGRTMSQITSAGNTQFERAHGYSLGTIGGVSDRADQLHAQRQVHRRRQLAQEVAA